MFNFEVNQHLFFALASSDSRPLIKAIKDTKPRPATAQWGFLRNHDELDLGRLNKKQRETVFAAFGPGKDMQLYQRGIRRRLAPMLQGDRRRLELAYSLMMTLPGTPVIRYGDEIGMGRRPSTAGTKLRAHGYAVVDRSRTPASRKATNASCRSSATAHTVFSMSTSQPSVATPIHF
jgi:glycosidase